VAERVAKKLYGPPPPAHVSGESNDEGGSVIGGMKQNDSDIEREKWHETRSQGRPPLPPLIRLKMSDWQLNI